MFLHLFQSKISIDLYFKKHYFKFLIETGHLLILVPRRVPLPSNHLNVHATNLSVDTNAIRKNKNVG